MAKSPLGHIRRHDSDLPSLMNTGYIPFNLGPVYIGESPSGLGRQSLIPDAPAACAAPAALSAAIAQGSARTFEAFVHLGPRGAR